jgi:hypothetical protein
MGKTQAWWHEPVIPAMIGRENRKIAVQVDLGKK